MTLPNPQASLSTAVRYALALEVIQWGQDGDRPEPAPQPVRGRAPYVEAHKGAPVGISMTERELWELNPEDHDWRRQFFGELPDFLAKYFGQRYARLFTAKGRREANTYLRDTMGKQIVGRVRMVMRRYQNQPRTGTAFRRELLLAELSREDIRELSRTISNGLRKQLDELSQRLACDDPDDYPAAAIATYLQMEITCKACGILPPYNSGSKGFTHLHAECGILRLICNRWWERKLKKARALMREHLAIAVGQVQKAANPYCSRDCLNEWFEQKRRNRAMIKAMKLRNEETGEEIELADMVLKSVANPAIRRCELMVRMRGFEDLAKELGMVGEFYTLTAPSSYHSVRNKGGFIENWNGGNPRDAQLYLRKVWARIRSAADREGVHWFGFRVVEPHHDGTPHWHLLLFMPPEQVTESRRIFARYAMAEAPLELPGFRARFDYTAIDPEKGSATGYIAKYISKNIDGFALDDEVDDETGENLKEMSRNVTAWASRWRIRQFQQIGGATVTTYRELRRLGGEVRLDNPELDKVLAAADVGDWAAYVDAQGGPFIGRDALIRNCYQITEQGNEYGEAVRRLDGVEGLGEQIQTRTATWTIVRKSRDDAHPSDSEGRSGSSAAPWSSVNNCTPSHGGQQKPPDKDPKDPQTAVMDHLRRAHGVEPDPIAIDALFRGGLISIDTHRAIKLRNGQLIEVDTDGDLWDGWNAPEKKGWPEQEPRPEGDDLHWDYTWWDGAEGELPLV